MHGLFLWQWGNVRRGSVEGPWEGLVLDPASTQHLGGFAFMGPLEIDAELAQGAIAASKGHAQDTFARQGILQAIEGPGQALLADPLHRTAIKTGPEGVVQGPAGILALVLEIAEAKPTVQVEANEIHQVIDAGIRAFAIGQDRQRLLAIAQIGEHQGRQKPIDLVVQMQGLDHSFPLVGDGTDEGQQPTQGFQETPARQIPLGWEGQGLVQNACGAAHRLPFGPTHGPGRTQQAMGIG
jgi:hypothetical protein